MKRKFTISLLLLVLCATYLFAQDKTIKGVVQDTHGDPIIGANVMVKGTSIGSATDLDGNYSISVPSSAKSLTVSYIGMRDIEVPIKGAAVLIIPGGGYARLAYIISGHQLAKWFNSIGINAFVLAHRLPHSPDLVESSIAPLLDAQQAMRVIRTNSDKWGIDVDKVGVMGSSAGGHLAAMLSTSTNQNSIIENIEDTACVLPSFQILISPVIDFGKYAHKGSVNNLIGEDATDEKKNIFSAYNNVSHNSAPAFIVHAFNDKSVNPMNSILYYEKLLENNVPSSLHIFNQGGHSIALRNNPGSTNEWTKLCEEWLIEMDIIPRYKQ